MKRFFPFVVVATLAASSDAQVSIGNRLGWSISHQESDTPKFLDSLGIGGTPLIGASAGLILESKIKPFLAAQLEFGLTQKGRQLSDRNLTNEYYRLRLIYGEAQFLMKGIVGKGPAKLNILAGVSFGRGLAAAERGNFDVSERFPIDSTGTVLLNGEGGAGGPVDTITYTRTEVDRLIDFNESRKGFLTVTELSLVGGLGASFDLGRSRIFLEGRYVQGLTPIYNGKLNEPDVFNRSILIQFGYLVQLNDPKSKTVVKPEAPQY